MVFNRRCDDEYFCLHLSLLDCFLLPECNKTKNMELAGVNQLATPIIYIFHDCKRGFNFMINSGLSFSDLRSANKARLPLFKNCHGEPAHSMPDGSDWSPAQWLQAVTGELGEYANLRKKFERGDVGHDEFIEKAAKELADVVTYLDILAFQLGIDLGEATAKKFNEVSDRVGCDIKLTPANNPYKDGVWIGTDAEVSQLPDPVKKFIRKLQDDIIAIDKPVVAVPDELHEWYEGEETGSKEYMQGWNDCRDAMIAAQSSSQQKPFGYFVDVEYCGFTREKPSQYLESTTALYAGPMPLQSNASKPIGFISLADRDRLNSGYSANIRPKSEGMRSRIAVYIDPLNIYLEASDRKDADKFNPAMLDKYFDNVSRVEHMSSRGDNLTVWLVVDKYGNESGRLSYFTSNNQWDIYVDNFPSPKKYYSTNIPIKSAGKFFDDVNRTGLVLVPKSAEAENGKA